MITCEMITIKHEDFEFKAKIFILEDKKLQQKSKNLCLSSFLNRFSCFFRFFFFFFFLFSFSLFLPSSSLLLQFFFLLHLLPQCDFFIFFYIFLVEIFHFSLHPILQALNSNCHATFKSKLNIS